MKKRCIGNKLIRPIDEGISTGPILISVITVSFNGGKELENTIESILSQTYQNIELIVIDGGSDDNTLDILKKYDSQIACWVSEPDKGIYDAMNKGIKLASGAYVNFMNCGDRFFSRDVISDIFQGRNATDFPCVIIYGDREIRYGNGKTRIIGAGDPDQLWKGSQFCHQAAFVALDYHKDHPYNEAGGMVSDFEFFFAAFKAGVRFERVPRVIASIAAGGISDVNRIEVIRSWQKIAADGFWKEIYYTSLIFRETLVSMVKKVLR